MVSKKSNQENKFWSGWGGGHPNQIGGILSWAAEAPNNSKCEDRVTRRRCKDKIKMGKTGRDEIEAAHRSCRLVSWVNMTGPWQRDRLLLSPLQRTGTTGKPKLASLINSRGKYWLSKSSTLHPFLFQSKYVWFVNSRKWYERKRLSYHPLTEVTRCPGMTFCCESGKSHPSL